MSHGDGPLSSRPSRNVVGWLNTTLLDADMFVSDFDHS